MRIAVLAPVKTEFLWEYRRRKVIVDVLSPPIPVICTSAGGIHGATVYAPLSPKLEKCTLGEQKPEAYFIFRKGHDGQIQEEEVKDTQGTWDRGSEAVYNTLSSALSSARNMGQEKRGGSLRSQLGGKRRCRVMGRVAGKGSRTGW